MNLADIQYVSDEEGNQIAVIVPTILQLSIMTSRACLA